jgi:hypothetical protein
MRIFAANEAQAFHSAHKLGCHRSLSVSCAGENEDVGEPAGNGPIVKSESILESGDDELVGWSQLVRCLHRSTK